MMHTVQIGHPSKTSLFNANTDWNDLSNYKLFLTSPHSLIDIPYGYDLPFFVRSHIDNVIIYTTSVSSHQHWLYEYYGKYITPSFEHFQDIMKEKEILTFSIKFLFTVK